MRKKNLKKLRRSRSQRTRGLRQEMFSPAQTLGSWVRIALEAWMSDCVSSVFVLSCIGRSDAPSKKLYRLPTRFTIFVINYEQQQARQPNP
jgi:hypothetical protein